MKQILCILWMLFSIGNINYAQKIKQITDLENDNLFGKVKTIQTVEYMVLSEKDTITKGEKISSLSKKYNQRGFLQESSEYNPDGSLMQKEVFEYDKKNNRTTEWLFSDENKIDQYVEIKYNTLRLPVKMFTKDEKGNTFQKNTYQYNEKSELTRLTGYDDRGKMAERSYYSYDNHGNLIQYTGYGEYDNRKISFQYNPENKIIESLTLDLNGNFTEKIVYQYNNDENSVRKIYLDKDSKSLKSELYIYDQYENLLEITLFDANGITTESHSFSYQYDKMNNWIIQTTYTGTDKKIVSVTERIIEYY
jgi:hypothetical protein